MKICVNSRDLSPCQRSRIEEYFEDNFTFEGRGPSLVWREDESDYILLGYPHGRFEESGFSHDFNSVMFRVHESRLMEIVGRASLNLIWPDGEDGAAVTRYDLARSGDY
jgi:hypothetical protein